MRERRPRQPSPAAYGSRQPRTAAYGRHQPGPAPYDQRQRHTAGRLTRRHPHWLVTWGTGSRRYWAYPRFAVPPGTVVSAADTQALLLSMRKAETGATARPAVPGMNPR
jgi:hypothetical protein